MTSKMGVLDQNKRTLEALERRFAVEAQHQLRNKRQSYEQGQGFSLPAGTSNDHSTARTKSTLLKKDTEANGLTYSSISHHVHENLLTGVEMSGKGKSPEDILYEILQNGDCAMKYKQGSRSVKYDHIIPLDSCVKVNNTSASCLKALKRNSKCSKRHMSMRQLKKKCGSFQLSEEFHQFERFMPMHEMWKEYFVQLLKKIGKNQLDKCLLDVDLHGAILRVIECKVDSFTGVLGIMIRETTETFGIITQDNKFRVVPKRSSVFALQAESLRITLYGDKFTSRTPGS